MKRGLFAGLIVGAFLVGLVIASAASASTEGECRTHYNHPGNIPGRYDFAVFYEHGYDTKTVYTNGQDIYVPPPQGRRSWDKVKKCTSPPTTTTTVTPTTTVPEITTTSTLPATTTSTTQPSTTTVPPTTTVPETTTSSSTTTTKPPPTTTSTTSPATTTSTPSTTVPSTVPPTTPTTSLPVDPPEELPDTGAPLTLFGMLAAGLLLLGTLALRATRKVT